MTTIAEATTDFLAQKRIAVAGYRIAALLNQLLDPSGK